MYYGANEAPKTWQLRGVSSGTTYNPSDSNTYTIISNESNQTWTGFATSSTPNTTDITNKTRCNEYLVDNPGSYIQYILHVTDVINSNSYPAIGQMAYYSSTVTGEKSGGSGGGARSAGENSKVGVEDVGGAGIPNDFRDGTYQWYAGGGGGGRETQTSSSITYGSEPGGGANASRVGVPYSLYKDRGGHGGIGVSGDAHFLAPVTGHSDTGNGGGAGGNDNDSTGTVGGNGGSGIVIIRYEIPTSE